MSDQATSSIDEYISTTLSQIQKGLPSGTILDGSVRFEMATVGQKDKGGKLAISIVNVGASVSESQTQKVVFAVKYPSPAEIAEEEAKKAQAMTSKILADRMVGRSKI